GGLLQFFIGDANSEDEVQRRFEMIHHRLERWDSALEGDLFLDLLRVDSLCNRAQKYVERKEKANILGPAREAASILVNQLARPSLHNNARSNVAVVSLSICLLLRRAEALEEAWPLAER